MHYILKGSLPWHVRYADCGIQKYRKPICLTCESRRCSLVGSLPLNNAATARRIL